MAKDALAFLDVNQDQFQPQYLDMNSTLFNTVANARKIPGILFSNKVGVEVTRIRTFSLFSENCLFSLNYSE